MLKGLNLNNWDKFIRLFGIQQNISENSITLLKIRKPSTDVDQNILSEYLSSGNPLKYYLP